MTSTICAPAIDLAIATAPPPQLPAVAAADAALPTFIEPPLTPEGLSAMLARRKQRSDGWTPIRVAAFLEALAETCSVTKAAAYVDMSTASAYHLRNHPDARGFREAWDSVVAARFEELTDIAMDRVRNGVEKLRWWKDEVVGREQVFSDRLLIDLLRRSDPARTTVVAALPVAALPEAITVTAGAAPVTLGAPRALAVLPMADDFIVAAAVDTGRLGWDPEHDATEADWPPEMTAEVERRRAVVAANVAAEQAFAAEQQRLLRIEDSAGAARMNADRARIADAVARDEAACKGLAELARLSKSLTCSSSRSRRPKR